LFYQNWFFTLLISILTSAVAYFTLYGSTYPIDGLAFMLALFAVLMVLARIAGKRFQRKPDV
jgi:uncharacterized membrane protein YeiB